MLKHELVHFVQGIGKYSKNPHLAKAQEYYRPMMNYPIIQEAIIALKKGEIIAYPTEAVFGLGCDPFNPSAVEQLLQLKRRDVRKGLILIADSWEQVARLTGPVEEPCLERALASWPGPITWVFPASEAAPAWIRGDNPSIALRVTYHPVASALCKAFGGPIVSTSANIEGEAPAKDITTLKGYFPAGIALILDEPLGDRLNPTPIHEVLTGQTLRF